MNRFLVETSYQPDDDAVLHVFDDIELTGFLSKNIERVHYSGDGYEINYIGQYLGNGKLPRLQLRPVGQQHAENDYLDWSYELTSAGCVDLGDDPECGAVIRPGGTLLGRLYPSANRQTWRACDQEVARGVPLAHAVAAVLKAHGDRLHGCHMPVPAPGTIVNVFGSAVPRGAQHWEYPLTGECATCHRTITLADSTAD